MVAAVAGLAALFFLACLRSSAAAVLLALHALAPTTALLWPYYFWMLGRRGKIFGTLCDILQFIIVKVYRDNHMGGEIKGFRSEKFRPPPSRYRGF